MLEHCQRAVQRLKGNKVQVWKCFRSHSMNGYTSQIEMSSLEVPLRCYLLSKEAPGHGVQLILNIYDL